MEKITEVTRTLEFTSGQSVLELSYLVAAILFVLGLRMLSHPDTARKGNFWAAFGMILAIITTIVFYKDDQGNGIKNLGLIFGALLIGSVAGWIIARKIKMTAMPQLVSFFNGTGGAAAALISLREFPNIDPSLLSNHGMFNGQVLVILLGLFIGSVSFTGSMIAYGKLDDKIRDIRASFLKYVNIILLIIVIGFFVYIMSRGPVSPDKLMPVIYLLFTISLIYGVLFVMPIGGADMPVVISLLNSFTGIAAAMGGFLYHNDAMLLGGILVGSAGIILTILMCKAMNRSLLNVIIGTFGGGGVSVDREIGTIKEISVSDAAVLLSYTQRVVIVPGYGLAVAQAQHVCNDMVKLLEEKGVEVKFAIHPVAGRMPGHMNVLLAEAEVPYEKLVELDDINPELPKTDVVIIIGANDVVNPAAEDDPTSPIYGMPIIRAHTAKNVIVMKRGMGKGYAAIENLLFYADNTRMLFGNAKDTLQNLVAEIKSL
ncbi:MAG: NAD(P) transhydrogenase subunit beta [Bacteroides sp. SM23_62_1]|nr:MAG: NAD(P) transhydrogenase subunit beta [Bacteroides sp. SM23_62_1]